MINLNKKEVVMVSEYPNGLTIGVNIKLGHKYYCLDICKNSSSTFIDFYEKKSANRSDYSKYSSSSSVLGLKVNNYAFLDRKFFENIHDIKQAEKTFLRFKQYL